MTQKHVFIATPTHDGNLCAEYVGSLLGSVAALVQNNIAFTHSLCTGNALIHDARNRMVSWFLDQKDATDLVFIDADIGWEPQDLVRLVKSPHDVIGGAYPQKREDIERYNVAGLKPTGTGLIEVDYLGTGFLKISRRAIVKLYEVHADKKYGSPEGVECRGLFEAPIEDGKITGEDAMFCRRWRNTGGKVFMFPDMTLRHVGRKVWAGNFAEMVARETANRGEAA